MARLEVPRGMKPEVIERFKPITVLDVPKKGEQSRKLELSIPEKIKFNLWTNAVLTGNQGFRGKLIINSRQLSEENNKKDEGIQPQVSIFDSKPVSILTVQIEPYTEADEAAIKNFEKRIQDAMKRYEEYKHPLSHVGDTTDYSNQIARFERFYLEGFDGASPERN